MSAAGSDPAARTKATTRTPTDHMADHVQVHRAHPVHHAWGCGLRIASPHPRCQATLAPFKAAELIEDHHGGVSILCHGCASRWAITTTDVAQLVTA